MKILLDQFEQQIDETILERGLSYFKKGHVLDMEETGRGQYEFTVEGSDIYTVQLKIKGNTVSHCSCDCPHDTLICKHIVACLFYLQKDLFADITTTSSKKEKKNRPAKPEKMSEAEQVKAILKVLSHEELKEVFYSACKKDSKLKLSFIATHLHLLEEESKDLYIKQLKILIKGYTGKYGFIEYRDSKQLCSKINEFIKKANTYCEQNQYSKAFYIATAILDTISETSYNFADDDGYLEEIINDTFQLLENLTDADLGTELHREFFDYVLNSFDTEFHKEGNMWLDLLELSVLLTQSQTENKKVLSLLDSTMQKVNNWYLPTLQELKSSFILKTEGKEATDLYITNHLSNPNFRRDLIKEALEAKDYNKAETLAQEGILQD